MVYELGQQNSDLHFVHNTAWVLILLKILNYRSYKVLYLYHISWNLHDECFICY